MVETTAILFCVSTMVMMILVRLVQEIFVALTIQRRAEEQLANAVSGMRSRMAFYVRRSQELEREAHQCLMGMGTSGSRAILDVRRVVGRLDASMIQIEGLIGSGDASQIGEAKMLMIQLNGSSARDRSGEPELHYEWEASLIRALDILSIEIMRATERLAESRAA